MSAIPGSDLSGVTHVAVGLSFALLADLDRLLPPASVLVVDEPDTLAARRARQRVTRFRCLAALIEAPTQDEPAAEHLHRHVPRPPGVQAVIPALEYAVVGAAALAQDWALPGQGLAAARILRDKTHLREAGDRHALTQPAWASVDGPAALDRFRARFGGRCVLKPANRQASVGVRLLDPQDDAAAAWAQSCAADEAVQRARSALPPHFLAEQRLEGPEFSVEALVLDGECLFANITAKAVQPGVRPVELGHVVPADLDPEVDQALRAGTDQLLAAVAYRTGVIHAEWIVVHGRPHLIECAGRLPGDAIDLLINLAYGCDLTADYLALLAGRRPEPIGAPRQAAAIRFLTAGPGFVTRIEGVEAARSLAGVVEAEVSVQVGDQVAQAASSWDRIGHVVATGAGAEQDAARAVAAATVMDVVTGPGPCALDHVGNSADTIAL